MDIRNEAVKANRNNITHCHINNRVLRHLFIAQRGESLSRLSTLPSSNLARLFSAASAIAVFLVFPMPSQNRVADAANASKKKTSQTIHIHLETFIEGYWYTTVTQRAKKDNVVNKTRYSIFRLSRKSSRCVLERNSKTSILSFWSIIGVL